MTATTQTFERWFIEAHSTRNGNDHWFRINLAALNGFEVWRNHASRVRTGHMGDHTYGESLAFDSEMNAAYCLADLVTRPQPYDLRVCKTLHVIVTEPGAPHGTNKLANRHEMGSDALRWGSAT